MVLVQLFLFELSDPLLAAQLIEMSRTADAVDTCVALNLLDEAGDVARLWDPSVAFDPASDETASIAYGKSIPVGLWTDTDRLAAVHLEAKVDIEVDLDVQGRPSVTVVHGASESGFDPHASWSPFANLTVLATRITDGDELREACSDRLDVLAGKNRKVRAEALDRLLPTLDAPLDRK